MNEKTIHAYRLAARYTLDALDHEISAAEKTIKEQKESMFTTILNLSARELRNAREIIKQDLKNSRGTQ